MEKYQEFNPFKFIIYSGQIGAQVPQLESKQQIPPVYARSPLEPVNFMRLRAAALLAHSSAEQSRPPYIREQRA